MTEKSTEEMNSLLENTSPDKIGDFYDENRNSIIDPNKEFYYYMRKILDEKGKKLKDVYSFAGFSESYGSQILRMEKHTPNRDVIIRLCIAGHFNVNETNKALKLYGCNELYSKDKRDACLIIALHNRKYDMADVDDMLASQDLKILSKDE